MALLHILGIDAAWVGVLGYVLVCRVEGEPVHAGNAWVLGMTICLAYIGDRWMDAERNPGGSMSSARHRLFHKHRRRVLGSWLALLGLDLCVACVMLSPTQFGTGSLVGLAAVGYAAASQRGVLRSGTKELCVGMLFGLGALGLDPWDRSWEAWMSALAIGLVCTLNCLALAYVERDLDRGRGEASGFSRESGAARGLGIGLILAFSFALAWIPRVLAVLLLGFAGITVLGARKYRGDPFRFGAGLDLVLAAVLSAACLSV